MGLIPRPETSPALSNGDRGLGLDFRHGNDQSMSLHLVAGTRVFVCDNLTLSGDMIVLRRKHTKGLSLRDEVRAGIERLLKWIEERLSAYPLLTLMEILYEASRGSEKLKSFLSLIESLRRESGTVSGLIRAVLEQVGYEAYLQKTFPNAMLRVSHLIQLSAMARRFAQEQCGDLPEFLLQSGLAASGEETEGRPPQSVRLMTIHAAKGLEFQTVFVMGLEDGILPYARCRDNLDEERRLFYVAVTRAKERLFVTWSIRRLIHGREIHHQLATFVKEIILPDGWMWSRSPVMGGRHPVIICPSPCFRKDTVAAP